MEELNELIYDRVHNKVCRLQWLGENFKRNVMLFAVQKWFTARGLESLSKGTGQSVDLLAKVICFFLFILLISSRNWIVCNTILVVVPLLLTYVYPNEKPPTSNMRVYWISAFIVTAFDRMLETFPLYYVIKLSTFLFLLVEPSCLNEKLKKFFKISEKSLKRAEVPVRAEPPPPPPPAPASAWGRFTESIRSALGGAPAPAPAPAPPPPPVRRIPSPQSRSRRSLSQRTAVLGTSESESQQRSPLSGAPTPYDTKPLVQSKVSTSTSEPIARASIAPGPPVGVGEKRRTPSTYIKIPKPTTKGSVASVSMAPNVGPNSSLLQPGENPPLQATPPSRRMDKNISKRL